MEERQHRHAGAHPRQSMYGRFAVMAIVMFIAMYFIMYAMIDGLQNFFFNLNNLYMTLLMVSAMLLIELWVMRKMYTDSTMNWTIVLVSVVIGVFSWFGIRKQLGVDDKQFVKGMIPHHAAALLMSEKARLRDPELMKLQRSILETQSKEIELMKRKLEDLKENK